LPDEEVVVLDLDAGVIVYRRCPLAKPSRLWIDR